MKYLNRIKLMTFLYIFIFTFLFSQPLSAQTVDKIIAIVNNEIITQSDADTVLAAVEAEYETVDQDPQRVAQKLKDARANIIKQMIEEKLILSEAKKYEFKVDEEEIAAQIEQIKEGFFSAEEFENNLQAHGLTIKELRDRFYEQQILKKAVEYFVRLTIKVDPQELNQFYQRHKSKLIQPQRAKIKSILIKTGDSSDKDKALEKAQEILERLKNGESFEELSQIYSQAETTAGVEVAAGELGFVEKGELIKELDQAIFSLRPGEFTSVFKTEQGLRIFEVEQIQPARQLSFSEAQERIRQILYKEKFSQAFRDWLDELKRDAYIVIKDPTLRPGE